MLLNFNACSFYYKSPYTVEAIFYIFSFPLKLASKHLHKSGKILKKIIKMFVKTKSVDFYSSLTRKEEDTLVQQPY